MLRVDEKRVREYYVPICCGVIYTNNHKAEGIYLPDEDRRHYVAWSPRVKEDFTDTFWTELWNWYDGGGDRHVAAYLAQLDLAKFNPKAPPLRTAAFWDIVNAGRSPEDAEMADVLDKLGNPDAVVVAKIVGTAPREFAEWLRDRRNRRKIPHRLEACGYVGVHNPDAKDRIWKIAGERHVVYSKASLSRREQLSAAAKLCSGSRRS